MMAVLSVAFGTWIPSPSKFRYRFCDIPSRMVVFLRGMVMFEDTGIYHGGCQELCLFHILDIYIYMSTILTYRMHQIYACYITSLNFVGSSPSFFGWYFFAALRLVAGHAAPRSSATIAHMAHLDWKPVEDLWFRGKGMVQYGTVHYTG